MDDLVADLREEERWGNRVCGQAADRIEKMEAALRDLSDGWECCPVSKSMRRVAREALEEVHG